MRNKSKKPVTLRPVVEAVEALAIVGFILCAIILLLSRSIPEIHPSYCFIILGFIPVIFVFLLFDALEPARITISAEGVHMVVRRTKEHIDLPWSDYQHLYILEGYKRSIYLFTSEPMDKETQLTCFKSCVKNKAAPFVAENCFILNAWDMADVIEARLPDHIQKMPWTLCAKL